MELLNRCGEFLTAMPISWSPGGWGGEKTGSIRGNQTHFGWSDPLKNHAFKK
jgi:hypothetical protein